MSRNCLDDMIFGLETHALESCSCNYILDRKAILSRCWLGPFSEAVGPFLVVFKGFGDVMCTIERAIGIKI